MPEGKYTINFSKIKKSPFDIKSESSYNAKLSKGSLELGLKKKNCIAWVHNPERDYEDHVIEARYRLNSLGSYAAAGIIFRAMDDDSYYMALVSSKGYFRLDVVKDNSPRTLIAWTEISDFNGRNIAMKIITYGDNLIFVINGKWLGEINDDTVSYGIPGFAAASYPDSNDQEQETNDAENGERYICMAYLDFISMETRSKIVENEYNFWTDDTNINAERRLRLAETFAVMDEPAKALDQINRAWKRRDEVIRVVSTSEVRTKKELLLAARMTFRLGQYSSAEELIDSILDQWENSPEGKLAYTEKLKILNELNKFSEIKDFISVNSSKITKDIDYYTILARSYWELNEYEQSAQAWDTAMEIHGGKDQPASGVYSANAANAYELAGKKKNALTRYIDAGRIFLNQDNKHELAAIMPKLSALGSKNWEARSLLGKWAFSLEDYSQSLKDFEASHKLRCAQKPRPKPDPAAFYLWGLVLNLHGKTKTAIRLLERAVKLAPEYGLFRFKLSEFKLMSGIKDPVIAEELKIALTHIDDPQGNMADHAGNLLLNAGLSRQAKYFFNLNKKQEADY